jgi:hypothetical protein
MLLSEAICRDRGVAALSPEAAVLFFMILAKVNAHGKMDGNIFTIKGSCCRYLDYITIEELPGLLREISQHTSVQWFADGEGNHWIHALKFGTYNSGLRRNRMGKDKLPSFSSINKGENAFTPGVLPEYSRSTPANSRSTPSNSGSRAAGTRIGDGHTHLTPTDNSPINEGENAFTPGVLPEYSRSTPANSGSTPSGSRTTPSGSGIGAVGRRVGDDNACAHTDNSPTNKGENAFTPGVLPEYSRSTPANSRSGAVGMRAGDGNTCPAYSDNSTKNEGENAFTPGVLPEYSGSEGKGKGEGKEKEKKNSAEPSFGGSALAPVEPILLADGSEYRPTQEQYGRLCHLYPGVNVAASIRSMSAWSLANPTRRKTARGILRFMNAWLDREQNSPKRSANAMPPDPYAHAARGREALLEE